ncbi:TPA: DUF262 domain-containing protein [Acinetobacter baumannii]|uniref:DUF262 domain-containing protein n=1 Tax=Acinetobacter baumannii TaxID=470 RepID=UPI00338D6269
MDLKETIKRDDDEQRALRNEHLKQIIDPIERSNDYCDFRLDSVRRSLVNLLDSEDDLVMNPDFQRGHVWTLEQQKFYIECLLKNLVPKAALTLTFNKPFWTNPNFKNEPLNSQYPQMVCVDGLQRFTAVEDFVNGKFNVFDDQVSFSSLKYTSFDLSRMKFHINFFEYNDPKDIIRLYLSLNTAGTAHSEDEIKRVRLLLADREKLLDLNSPEKTS